MDEDVACGADDLTKCTDGQVWQKLLLGRGSGYEVAWDTAAAVKPMGSLVYFAQYLSAGGRLDGLVRDCPLEYKSGNAPGKRAVWKPLLAEPYGLDIDNTIKPLYGHQEGAELGYNPRKPGRPSHNYHTYFIGSLRLVLSVEVHAGKEHAGRHSMPGLWALVDSLPAVCRPRLIRGDVSYGNEQTMFW